LFFGNGCAVAMKKYKFDATCAECIGNHAAASCGALAAEHNL
jgi:hypothetical protein